MSSNNEDRHPLRNTAVALTSLVGAAAFHKSGGTRMLAKSIPKISKFANRLMGEVSDMAVKDFDYDGISSLYKRSIKNNDSIWNQVAKEANNKISLKTNRDNAIGAFIKYKEIQANGKALLKKQFNTKYADEIISKIKPAKGLELNKELSNNIGDFVRHVVEHNDLVSHIDLEGNTHLNQDMIDSFFDPKKINLGTAKDEFFGSLIENLENKSMHFDAYVATHTDESGNIDLIKSIGEQFNGKTFAESFGSIDEQAKFGAVLEPDRGLTINEYLDSDKFEDQIINLGDGKLFSLKDDLRDFVAENEGMGNVYVDRKNLRINDKNEITDLTAMTEIGESTLEKVAGTLPGKIFKVTDYLSTKETNFVNYFSKGKASPILNNDGTLRGKEDAVEVLGKFFSLDRHNRLTQIEGTEDLYSRTNKHGTLPRMYSRMFGLESSLEATNKYSKWFDVGTTTDKTVLEKAAEGNGFLAKKAREITGISKYNIMDRALDKEILNSDPIAYRENLKEVNRAMAHISKAPNIKTLSKIEKVVEGDVSKEILRAIQMENHEDMLSLLSLHMSEFRNGDLKRIVELNERDRANASRVMSIRGDKVTDAKKIMKSKDLIRIEALKEVLANEAYNERTQTRNTGKVMKKLKDAGLKDDELKNAEHLTHWINLQMKGNLFNKNSRETVVSEMVTSNEAAFKLLAGSKKEGVISTNAKYVQSFQEYMGFIGENYKDLMTSTTDNTNRARKIRGVAQNDMIVMRKGYSPKQYALDMIQAINEDTKGKANKNIKANTEKLLGQFIAGRDNPNKVTSYTMLPYFLSQRLVEPFNEYGLGFSNNNTKDVMNIWSSIMAKRVIPIAAGITAFSYLNYETKNLTGTSITGAMAQGIANVDLGVRKIADITGVGHLLEAERRLNPLTQYWFGEDYQNSQERKDYYENGYDAVRKGRWWAFGSASEFRGGKISYFQPNFVKRANSDWKDIGLYGSSKEKWAHSWVPTLRHPFAPLRRALDPYWLERKHAEDRPYMETAPLFSIGTPWGAVLNPTIGEIFKPVRRMHRNETRRGLVDPRTLIQERNERIKARANDKEGNNIFRLSNEGISNVKYVASANADPSKTVLSLSIGNGQIQSADYNGVGYTEGLEDFKDAQVGLSNEERKYIGVKTTSPLLTALETSAIGIQVSNQVGRFFDSTSAISAINNSIRVKAASKSDGTMIETANLAQMPFKQASQRAMTRQDESDLLLTSSNHDFLNDALFSVKQQSGIYGYLAGLLPGGGGRKVRRESADKMVSFKRGFWDSNIGGLGGGVMEIARRFFPHDDHSWTDINPIKNTMPEWMPVRFQTGDPYTKLPKGEMRLPGAGYESIHKLRSDEYGKYGALDRMRILGDIAPWSEEYKIWRDVAKKSVSDEAGKKEIEAIKARVEKQGKAHEFYNYKFLNNQTKITKEIVDTIDGTNITTVSGKTYNMAGIKLKKDTDMSQYLVSGMSVSMESLRKDTGIGGTISAAVYVDGNNINKQLVDNREASGDTKSSMGAQALTGQLGRSYGAMMEAITHAPIPFIHNKLMKIDTPLESYKNERVYGTPYSTWDHPIKGFIEPAFQKSWARGPLGQGIAIGAWALAEQVWKNSDKVSSALKGAGINMSETAVNRTAGILFNMANPGAFSASMMAAIPTGLMGNSEGIKGLFNGDVFGAGVQSGTGRNAGRIGAIAMIAGYGITRSDKPLQSMPIFALAGAALSKQLNHESFKVKDGAIAGAATGLLISAIRNPAFNKEKMFGKYTPKSTLERWDIDEYYDRLEYIKYEGLFNKAARRARFFEGVNIAKIIRINDYNREKNKKKIEKLDNRLAKVSNSKLEDTRKQQLIEEINQEKYNLTVSEQFLKGGKYTKAAIAYKQAAESTIYGLKEDATSTQVLRAIPKGDKDFFMEFSKEKNKKKQDEILKYVSPYQKRALQIAWGREKIDNVDSNSSYFRNHFLPGTFWAGWKPQVNLENVKIKTIENEGMLLSDFGIYESQSNEPSAVMAPSIQQFDNGNKSGLGLQARLQGALQGTGLIGVKVSVSPTSANGIEVIANVTNAAKIAEYKVREGIGKVFGTGLFY